jgi:hypothetical protein
MVDSHREADEARPLQAGHFDVITVALRRGAVKAVGRTDKEKAVFADTHVITPFGCCVSACPTRRMIFVWPRIVERCHGCEVLTKLEDWSDQRREQLEPSYRSILEMEPA